MNPNSEVIQSQVHRASSRATRALMPSLPQMPRASGDVNAQIAMTLAAIENVSGLTRRVNSRGEFQDALAELVRTENVSKATLWQTRDLQELGVEGTLARLGVEMVSPHAGKWQLAECDLGITGADAVLPQTGTLALRTTPEQPELVSLLPRVHLAIFRPSALRADMCAVFAQVKRDRHFVLITGPSRTTDIEKVLAIGVHGPKVLYVWSYA